MGAAIVVIIVLVVEAVVGGIVVLTVVDAGVGAVGVGVVTSMWWPLVILEAGRPWAGGAIESLLAVSS